MGTKNRAASIEKVIVTGSRKWANSRALFQVLDSVNPYLVIHGGALGADRLAHQWCRDRGRIAVVHFPDYENRGKRAPLDRNIAMLEAYQDAIVVAAPMLGGTGTQHTIREATNRGMRVLIVGE